MILDPRRVLTFREVARLRSFSRAAEELSLTQPAVSQQILSLEGQLGTRLIDRGPGGLDLTPAGALLLRHADAVSGRLRLATEQLGVLVAEERRRLAIGAFPSAIATIVPEALVRMRAVQPDLELSVSEAAQEELAAAVRDGIVHRTCVAAGFEPNLAFLTRDVLAFRELVSSGLAVTLTGRLLAGRLEGIATPAVTGNPARRTIYAVRPSTGSHPLTDRLLAELNR